MKIEKKIYTQSDKIMIIELHNQGYTDSEIVYNTDFKYSFVGKTTTKYWKDKMKNKKL